GRTENSKSEHPDSPPFSAVPDVVLPAGEKENRGKTEEVCRLISIWEWPEAALVMPERKRGVGVIQSDAKRREKHDAGGKGPQLRADFAQVEIERAHIVEPAQPGQETNETSETDPRLGRKRGRESEVEIIDQD